MSEKITSEIEAKTFSGYQFLILSICTLVLSAVSFLLIGIYPQSGDRMITFLVIIGIVFMMVFILLCIGFFMLTPNQACVLNLFGAYKGTVKATGFMWVNPFYTKKKISLRSRNLNGEKLKVNDLIGNPIEIAAVIVWKVADTFRASFDVENYDTYVKIQSESAVRHLASMYPYDFTEGDGKISLRGNTEEGAETLKQELQERFSKAGICVEEARISHLAYAPEIASAMLQRQAASAVIAARQKIVEGAVGMVEMAIGMLNEKGVVNLDEERKAAMVCNLMVVLCSEKAASPVVNAGTLYH
jgi:regulator of protease activity HflC (stomatin/prohibitin superfamily)